MTAHVPQPAPEAPAPAQRVRQLERENAELRRELAATLEQQTATAEVLRAIASAPTSLGTVLDALVRTAARLTNADEAVILRIEGSTLPVVASTGGHPPISAKAVMPLDDRSVSGRAIRERRAIVADEPREEHEAKYPASVMHKAGFQAEVVAPLLHGDAVLGTLIVYRRERLPFDERQVELLETFADQAAIAIENARLFRELQDRNRDLTEALEQQTATAEVLKVISRSVFDLEPVLETLLKNAARLCAAPHGLIYRFDGELLRVAAAYNVAHEHWASVERDPPVPGRGSAVGRAALERRTVHIPDALADPDYTHPSRQVAGFRTLLAVPMLRAGGLVGVFVLFRGEAEPFVDRQIELVTTFADEAAIAIENVRLVRELQDRVEELKALGAVGRAVNSTLDLQEVLTTIVSRAVQLSRSDGGVIYEYDDAPQEFLVCATRNLSEELVEALRAAPIRLGEGAIGRAAASREPVQVSDIRAGEFRAQYRFPRLPDAIEGSGLRALLAVPLLREDRILGGLVVVREEPGEFPPGVVALMRTFASQSALAIQNARLFRELGEKSAQLEEASRHKSEFLANMSHELRTPLIAINGFSELLLERALGDLNEGQDQSVRDILASGRHLLSLINDALDLSKVEAGRMELELSRFSLPAALEHGRTMLKERASRHRIALGLEVDPAIHLILADERKVKQVVFNLLSNAVKFTPEGGRVDVTARRVDDEVRVAVRDTGVGIAPEDQARIFEEFRQVGMGPAKAEGTGLGLALTRKLVELHGGRIWVESQLGAGSTFTFSLPLRRSGATGVGPEGGPGAAVSSLSTAR